MMAGYLNFRELVWLFVSVVEVLFLVFLLARRLYRSYPFFFLYILTLVLQTAVVAFVYRRQGGSSLWYWITGWYSQAAVIGMRWLAVVEIARKIFSPYLGVWKLVGVILLTASVVILAYSVAVSTNRFDLMVMSADRRLELFIAVFVLAVFAFARYYRLPMSDTNRQLAIGFCLYSCVWVINDTLFEGWRAWLGSVWDFIQTIAFLTSAALWFSALRAFDPLPAAVPKLALSPELHAALSQEVNSRLLTLNSRLNQLFRSKDTR